MVKIRDGFACIFIALCILPQLLFGTAFLRPKYSKAVDFQYLYYGTDHFWSESGKKCKSFNDFRRNSSILSVEYGLTNRCTIAAFGSYEHIDESLNGKTQGFDDVEVSIKHFLFCKRAHVFSAEGRLIIPVDSRKTELRYGQYGGQISLLSSRKFKLLNRSGWYDGKLGYRFYQGFPSDQLRASATVGLCLNSRLTVLGAGKLEYGVWNGKPDLENVVRYNSNYRLFKIEGKAYFRVIKNTYLTVGGFRHVWGRNVGTGGGVFGGARINF